MKRTMLKSEIAELSEVCFNAILQGESPVDVLEAKGIENPTEAWYDIRRWMKSNAPTHYAGIPMKYRIELPHAESTAKEYVPPTETVTVKNKDGTVSTVKLYGPEAARNPLADKQEKLVEQPGMVNADKTIMVPDPEEEPKPDKKKRGRPKGWKKPMVVENKQTMNAPVAETENAKIVEEARADTQEEFGLSVSKVESKTFSFCVEKEGRISVSKNGTVLSAMILNDQEARELCQVLPKVFGMLKALGGMK